jgi:hypothetical protein
MTTRYFINTAALCSAAFLTTLVAISISTGAIAEEISLFDSRGEATAYISTDHELTIYKWEGKPMAYLSGEHIYGYNGKHLGWFDNGIVWDHKGRGVGFVKGAVSMSTNLESLKGLKELRSLKSLKELAPLKPLKTQSWAPIPLSLFLAAGSD